MSKRERATAVTKGGDDKPKRQRLPPAARRDHILKEAIQYFSEVGFDGGTRELAVRLGVKQPLLYRYFPSKEDLIKEGLRDRLYRPMAPRLGHADLRPQNTAQDPADRVL